jgi:Amiloride-sensitive sodium channel
MKTISQSCNCLPTCNSITYDAEFTISSLNRTGLSNFQNELGCVKDFFEISIEAFEFFSYEYTQLNIYFKENQIMTSERRERYGSTDFLANCGGLLALFLGISIISFVEIIYFCTIRLWYNLKNPNDIIHDYIETDDPRTGHGYLKIVKNLIVDYFSKTSIQGVRFVADTKLSLIERFWWMIVVVISIFCCGSLILDAVRHYDQSPIIVRYANEETPVSQVSMKTSH